MKLYEITSEYRQALAIINNCDLTDLSLDEQQDLISNTLDPFEYEFQHKALAIGAFIANLELEADALKTMEQRIQVRRKANERKALWLRDYLQVNMEMMKLTDISDNQIRLTIKKNPPRVCIDNENAIPETYKEIIETVKISKSAIATALKAGLEIKGARLENSQRLDIR